MNIPRSHQTFFCFRSYVDITNIRTITSRMHALHVRVVLLYGQKNQKPPPRENRGVGHLAGLNGRLKRFCKQNGPVSPTGQIGCFSSTRVSAGGFETLPAPASTRRSPSGGSALFPRFPQGGRRAPTLFKFSTPPTIILQQLFSLASLLQQPFFQQLIPFIFLFRM